MSRAFFLGSGASAAAGAPLIPQFMWALAHYVTKKTSPTSRRVYAYLNTVFGVDEKTLRLMADAWTNLGTGKKLEHGLLCPDFITVLSVLDVAASEESSFGQSLSRKRHKNKGYDLSGNELERIRDEIISAVVAAFAKPKNTRAKIYERFLSVIAPDDQIITTNWDTLLDVTAMKKKGIQPEYASQPITLVDARGHPVRSNEKSVRTLYKLHGSLNWLYCPRCGMLYANRDMNVAPVRGERPSHSRCHFCGPKDIVERQAELIGVIVSPTLLKAYNIPHLRNVWLNAQGALAKAAEWVFIGYSMPRDDVWVATMLLRAMAVRRSHGWSTSITVVARADDESDLVDRFQSLFGQRVQFVPGFDKYLDEL